MTVNILYSILKCTNNFVDAHLFFIMSLHVGDSFTRSLRLSLVTTTPFVFCASSSMNLTNNHSLSNGSALISVLQVSWFSLRLSCKGFAAHYCTQQIFRPKNKIYVFELHVQFPSIWITKFNINDCVDLRLSD